MDAGLKHRDDRHISLLLGCRGKECLRRTGSNHTKQKVKDGGASRCHPSKFSRALGFICPLECLLMHGHKASSYQILIASEWVNWFRWSKSYTRTVCTFTSLLSMFCPVSKLLGLGWNQKQSTRIFLKYSSLWLTIRIVKQLCPELYSFYLFNALIYKNCFTENFDTALPWKRSEFKIRHLKLIKYIRNSK